MKCPKCGYLGFEQVDRCRNCGYEFSLAAGAAVPELPLHLDARQDVEPLEGLSLLSERSSQRRTSLPPDDLPLFSSARGGDEPLISRPSPPRPPLAVRRATPDMARVRTDSRPRTLDLGFESEPSSPPSEHLSTGHPASIEKSLTLAGVATVEDATLVARVLAAAIDVFILAGVDALVIYFTIQICGIAFSELGLLPKGPLVAFLFAQNGAYLVGFTRGGQTLGKMAAGIKVVGAGEAEQVDLGRAVRRTVLWLILATPAGLGFVTALFRTDHRGLHDRLAGTRVVRATT